MLDKRISTNPSRVRFFRDRIGAPIIVFKMSTLVKVAFLGKRVEKYKSCWLETNDQKSLWVEKRQRVSEIVGFMVVFVLFYATRKTDKQTAFKFFDEYLSFRLPKMGRTGIATEEGSFLNFLAVRVLVSLEVIVMRKQLHAICVRGFHESGLDCNRSRFETSQLQRNPFP